MAEALVPPPPILRRLDALLLALLLFARLRIDSLAEAAVLPARMADVAQQPFLGRLLSPQAMRLLAQQGMVDPVGLLLIAAALGCLLLYLLVDEAVTDPRVCYRLKLGVIWAIVLLAVFAPSAKLMLLRHSNGPASYSHDGGVIQTEAAIDFVLEGRNPYTEDYTGTAMAEWGISEFRTALYHYPYLPWTFLFSAPFKLLAEYAAGWYDQRMVYLLLFGLALAVLPALARAPSSRLLLVMAVGLNPIMGSDLIYGQNDSFVLAWIVLALWCWAMGKRAAGTRLASAEAAAGMSRPPGGNGPEAAAKRSQAGLALPGVSAAWDVVGAAFFGLACASKPTAWFMAPFLFLLWAGDGAGTARGAHRWRDAAGRALRTGWVSVAVAAAIILPYAVWDLRSLWDDVWAWSNGTSATAYQIWGWGASNLVLALGWVSSRFSYWPFWLPELVLGAPLLWWLWRRQASDNTVGRALWGYGIFLLAFFFVSRFLNENYLGYIAALLALGALAEVGDKAGAGRDRPG